jgi:mono/diheme cytochrome c family protein
VTAKAYFIAKKQARRAIRFSRAVWAASLLGFGSLAVAEGVGSEATSEVTVGMKEFQRNCASCHFAAMTFAPAITKYFVQSREDAVRKLILEGGVKMPAFKYLLNEQQADAIIAYIKTLDTPPKTIASDRIAP